MSVQERNSEMVEILSPDFVRRKDSTYQAGALAGAIMALPGIVSYWPMGVALEERTTLFADEVMIGSDVAPAYDLQIVNGGTNAAAIDGAFRAGQGGLWAAIDGPSTGWAGFGTNFYYNGNTPTYRETNLAAQIFISNQFLFRNAVSGGAGTPITWVDIAAMDNLGQLALGIGNTFPGATLDVARGASGNGAMMIRGTNYISHFYFGGNDDTYIRGGKPTSIVYIADVNNGGTVISNSGGPTTFGGRIGSVWTGFSFGSGWTNYGGYSLGSYKKVGDMVFLRGLVTRTSGVGTLIGVLPVGFRPLATELFDVITDTGQGRIDIDSFGSMTLISGGAGWVGFSAINFSTI